MKTALTPLVVWREHEVGEGRDGWLRICRSHGCRQDSWIKNIIERASVDELLVVHRVARPGWGPSWQGNKALFLEGAAELQMQTLAFGSEPGSLA